MARPPMPARGWYRRSPARTSSPSRDWPRTARSIRCRQLFWPSRRRNAASAAAGQIAAEELDVEPARVRIVSGDTERTPNEGYTTGSMSIEMSGGSIRLVCAEVRRLFVQKLAAELRCDPAELAVADGRFLRGQTDTGYDYWRLAAGVDLARDATGNAPIKHPSEHRVIGRSFSRLELA